MKPQVYQLDGMSFLSEQNLAGYVRVKKKEIRSGTTWSRWSVGALITSTTSSHFAGLAIRGRKIGHQISVIIPSQSLRSYLKTLQFPVEILEEKGQNVARIEDRRGLLVLIDIGAVIGIGTWKRIRHLRLNRPTESMSDLRVKLQVSPLAAASRTTFELQLDSGHRVHSFHGQRCLAYRQGRERLDLSAV